MKMLTKLYIAFLCMASPLYAFRLSNKIDEYTGKSFMFTRPGYSHVSMHEHFWHNIIYNKPYKVGAALQGYGFYTHTMKDKKVNEFFTINRKQTLLVSGDANAEDALIRDIRAEWLNLPDNFRGELTIKPEQTQYGITFEYNQDLGKLSDFWFFDGTYLSILAPIILVENDLHLEQTNVRNARTGTTDLPRDIIEAFNQPAWCYGKIAGKRKEHGLAELEFRFGRSFYSKDGFQIASYSKLLIPTAKRQNSEFLFDPYLGHNRHAGLGAAVLFQIRLNRDPRDYDFSFFLNLEGTLLIRNSQRRTYSLKDKDWSRFMLYNVRIRGQQSTQNVPGVNLLTFKSKVWPFGFADFSTGWRFKSNHFEMEIGYSLWGHGPERLRLKEPIQTVFGIAGSDADTTASQSTIGQQTENDDEFTPIVINDLDFYSAASPSAITHKGHFDATISYHGKHIEIFIGGGAHVEIPQKNTALRMWATWVKLGATF